MWETLETFPNLKSIKMSASDFRFDEAAIRLPAVESLIFRLQDDCVRPWGLDRGIYDTDDVDKFSPLPLTSFFPNARHLRLELYDDDLLEEEFDPCDFHEAQPSTYLFLAESITSLEIRANHQHYFRDPVNCPTPGEFRCGLPQLSLAHFELKNVLTDLSLSLYSSTNFERWRDASPFDMPFALVSAIFHSWSKSG